MDDVRFNELNEAVAQLLCRQRGLDWGILGEDGSDWGRPLEEPRRSDFREWAFAIQMLCRDKLTPPERS